MYIVTCCAKSPQLCITLCSPMVGSPTLLPPHWLLCPWDSPGKNLAVGCHALLQGIFLTQGSNACFVHCRQVL